MIACVTGATGFVGGHVAHVLADAGHTVRVTYRDAGRLDRLGGTPVEPVEADVLDGDALRRAFEGADVVFHTAGVVGSSERAWRVNAVGPRIAVEAAAAARAWRFVHTSSVVAVGPAAEGALGREDDVYRGGGLGLAYVDSKHEGEVEAMAAALRNGVEIVVANPAYILGVPVDRSAAVESSSRRLLDFIAGRTSMLVEAPTNVVDVRDVAIGHLLAAERGRAGERYILGGHNRMWSEIAERMQEASGIRHPVLMAPRELARVAHVQHLMGLPGVLTGGLLTRLTAPNWQYSSEKAEAELGYRPRPLDETLADAAAWYRELVAAGRIDGADEGGPRALRAAQRFGALGALRAAERLSGRRLVVGG
ncbi:MAG TPA: NAD-dependent epimerase/dehydratase family protein [Thermoleophilaceae bacterium]